MSTPDTKDAPRYGSADPVTVTAPTTSRVRLGYAHSRRRMSSDPSFHAGIAVEEFDRWLAAHDAEVRAKALEDAAQEFAVELEHARTALEALGTERNTWARQMADLRDELDTARATAEKARTERAAATNERDTLSVALDDAHTCPPGRLVEKLDSGKRALLCSRCNRVLGYLGTRVVVTMNREGSA